MVVCENEEVQKCRVMSDIRRAGYYRALRLTPWDWCLCKLLRIVGLSQLCTVFAMFLVWTCPVWLCANQQLSEAAVSASAIIYLHLCSHCNLSLNDHDGPLTLVKYFQFPNRNRSLIMEVTTQKDESFFLQFFFKGTDPGCGWRFCCFRKLQRAI